MALVLQNCRISAGRRTILDVERIEFAAGRTTAVVGPNGAGKSTLLKSILAPGTQASWQGGNVQQALKQGRFAWVGQHESFQLPMSVEEYVLMGCVPKLAWYRRPGADDRRRAAALLDDFDLGGLAGKRLETLSGGEKQRAAVVRALMQQSEVLLLDEPTNHLDIRHQHSLMQRLRDPSGGRTVIMVLHDLNLAAHYSDDAVLMKDGRITAAGATADVMQPPQLSSLYDWPIVRTAEGGLQAQPL